MPIYSSFNTNNKRFSKAESLSAFAHFKGQMANKSNQSYTYNANPENYSDSINNNHSNNSQRSHYESWCYTDSQGTTYEPVA